MEEVYYRTTAFDERRNLSHILARLGPDIMREEIKATINTLKERNPPEPDRVIFGFPRLLGDESITFLSGLVTSTIPETFQKNV